MKRSLPAFIIGLITSIFSLFWGFSTVLFGNFITALISGINSSGGSGVEASSTTVGVVIMILGWLGFLGGILGIIGASQCFKKAKIGGILLTISSVLCGSLLIYLFVKTTINTGTKMLVTSIMIYLVPVALFIASTICAFLAKPYQPKPNLYYNQNGQQYGFNPNMNNQQNGYYTNNQYNNQNNQSNYPNNQNNQDFENNNPNNNQQ